ncbi:MAG: hypothetical protein AB1Z19_01355 [Eubacteriales bacterium]
MKTNYITILCYTLAIGLLVSGCMPRETANDYGQAIVSGVVSGLFTVLGVLATLFAGRKTLLRQMGIQNTPLLTAYLKSLEENTHQLALDITDGDDEPTSTKIRAQSLETSDDVTLCFKNDGNGTAKDIEYGSTMVTSGEHLFNQRELRRLYRRTRPRAIPTLHEHPHHLIKSDVLELTITFDNGSDFSRVVMVHYRDIINHQHLQKVLVEKRGKSIYLYPISEDFFR